VDLRGSPFNRSESTMKHEKFRFRKAGDLKEKAASLGIALPWSESVKALLQPAEIRGIPVPNRLVVQPMEGFDSGSEGTPGEFAFRRYGRYAAGGSGMIWFEAVSVSPDGRSNPHQMMITKDNVKIYKELVDHIRMVALANFGQDHRPFVVIQLTHSGRYSKPHDGFVPKIFSDNPFLLGLETTTPPTPLPRAKRARERSHVQLQAPDPHARAAESSQHFFTDSDLDQVRQSFLEAMSLADEAGFDAVDVKACHGYLLHEMLFAFDRTDSRYGGSFGNRTRFLREVLETPTRMVKAVRLSGFDMIPYPWGFGMKPDGSDRIDLSEPKRLIQEFAPVVPLWNISAGIPRYNSFVGRPFDRGVFNGPAPDEHQLTGIMRLIGATGELQQSFPDLMFVGSAYTWLRHFYPYVGAGVLERKMAAFIGLGRGSIAYPDSPKDLMDKGMVDPKKTCTSCSRCTELMRLEALTGCAIRDEVYSAKSRKERGEPSLAVAKREDKGRRKHLR
jgi:2,4-dienoyl-CoA reductase (NADPH2)